jgi:hypothetical protein
MKKTQLLVKKSFLCAVSKQENEEKAVKHYIQCINKTRRRTCKGIVIGPVEVKCTFCDFLAYTNKGLDIQKFSFDQQYWRDMTLKLRTFWTDVMSEIREV